MNKNTSVIKKVMIALLSIVVLVAVTIFFYMRQAKFGQAPTGERLERMMQTDNYKNNAFQNIEETPSLTEGYSMTKIFFNFLFAKFPETVPVDSLPSVKTDLFQLPIDSNILIWFGHSSYYLQLNGKRFLVDPVFSGNASPLPGTNLSFNGSDIYSADDIPPIDYLMITHDHYDHLDYETVLDLEKKVGKVICGLGVGQHFERWGYSTDKIIEKNWYETIKLENDLVVHTAPTRHFSGRGFSRNNTLWMSFVLESPTQKVYIGGDSGYGKHFAQIGEEHGPIDLAILDNGQYNEAWQAIHMLPEEVLKAAADLKAKRLLPVHSSKFKLAYHPWNEPLNKITMLNGDHGISLVTPMIGEELSLNDVNRKYSRWWDKLH